MSNYIPIIPGLNVYDKDYVEKEIHTFSSNAIPYLDDKRYSVDGESYEYYRFKNPVYPTFTKTYTYDYSKDTILGEKEPKLKVIRTIRMDHNSETSKKNRLLSDNIFKQCFDIEREINEDDIYNYLTSVNNMLISVFNGKNFIIYCLNRQKMSDRAVYNQNFRVSINGVNYVKFMPKCWVKDEDFYKLLNEAYSVYLLHYTTDMDKLYPIPDDEEYFPLSQSEVSGHLMELKKYWNIFDTEKFLQ